MGFARTLESRVVDEGYGMQAADSEPSRRDQSVCSKMLEADGNECTDLMRCLLKSNEKIGAVLQVQVYAGFLIAHHCPCVLYSHCMA